MEAWFILIIVYLTVFISSPLISLFHELGHAISYLIFTKPEKIDIYVGSYGNKNTAINFKIGKLEFYIKKSFPFVKGVGLCASSKAESNYIKYIIILLAGVVFNLLWAILFASIAAHSGANDLVKIFCYVFLGISILSLIVNLIPGEVKSSNGYKIDNDGKLIIFCLQVKRHLPDYLEARKLLSENENELAISKLLIVSEVTHNKNKKILRMLIDAYTLTKQHKKALKYLNLLEKQGDLSVYELPCKGCMQSFTRQYDEAMETYREALKLDKNNVQALHNVAYTLIEKGAFIVAQRAIDKVVKIDPKFYPVYNNMGYSKILQGELEEGKALIDKYIAHNAEDAYAYKALGIYYVKMGDENFANINFDKALELDNTIDLDLYRTRPGQLQA